ncbi:uncharacterized protein LOC117532359 isoform X2 [Gymnodraco acuticeps]|uniref:Uncharacterized protein LOC117532359 isoform X2 n=1 Tax=Gymnodraco acuticeps TaxID=8218 RepID=A0A6P8SV86_GYMAC|nr:uncharacterized protein LOC117532359 isoform X2 [Gymnodraco acuticeps]
MLRSTSIARTLLMSIAAPGGIVSAMRQTFQAPPAQKQLPTAQLLRHAFLLAEANNVQDYRSQILSTFGTVVKMDSTKKVVKLSGQGRGSAEWFTSIGNEYSQIVTFVLTCEESAQKLLPMCRGVMDRFRLANQPVPKILYIDRGCCRAKGPTALETMFQEWFDGGMVVCLDIFHWIHRFDAAIRTDAHSKYAMFKSALAGAVLAYNRTDLELLIEAVRAKDPDTFRSVSEQDVVRLYVTRDQLQHHVRMVTLGAQQTFRLIHLAIEELKGPAGLDQSGVSLFKTPGPHCAARPYQVYLISGIARWNCDRSSDAVFGGKGRHHRTYSAPLIHRLNTRCQQLFGETVEENFRAPAEVDSNELLGLEYLFSQSTGESGPFSLEDIIYDVQMRR